MNMSDEQASNEHAKCPGWCRDENEHGDGMHWSDFAVPKFHVWGYGEDSGPSSLSVRLGRNLTREQSLYYLKETDSETGEETNFLTISPLDAMKLGMKFRALFEQLDLKEMMEIFLIDAGMPFDEENLNEATAQYLEYVPRLVATLRDGEV